MPKGTRVERCVEKVKRKGGNVNPYAVCQAATKQAYATGKKLKSQMPMGVEMSPMGDIGEHRVMESHMLKGFKGQGSYTKASSRLPFTREITAGDYPGLPHIRHVSYDNVV